MKKLLSVFLSVLLVFAMLLTGCGPKDQPPESDENGGISNADGTYSVTSSYLPATLSAQMKTQFEGCEDESFTYATQKNAPFVIIDDLQISDCKVKSITIPVWSTGRAEDGSFVFTLSVVKADKINDLKDTMADPLKTYKIKIDASRYELEESTLVRKFIQVQLDTYDIELKTNQTLAFGAPNDTIIPAIIKTDVKKGSKNPAAKTFIDDWGIVGHYYLTPDENTFTVAQTSLLFDVAMERTYESKAAYEALVAKKAQANADYEAKLAAVKAVFEGKNISMMGDSISTHGTVTNNTSYNPTIGNNYVYAPHKEEGNSYHYSKVYWGRLATDLGMNLDVMNAWSGGRVYGRSDLNYVDNMLLRSYQLANTAGTDPDLVILYYGINDINNSPSSLYSVGQSLSPYSQSDATSDLYQKLQSKGTKTTIEVMDEWFTAVQQKATAAGYVRTDANPVIIPGTTYTSWEAAYALSLYNILNSYDNPEVYIMTLVETNHSSASNGKLDRANLMLRAFAEYFGVGLIDQQEGYLNKANCHLYTYDTNGLHPNIQGHALMTKLIVETLYEDLNAQ